jgi:hypothetical protein
MKFLFKCVSPDCPGVDEIEAPIGTVPEAPVCSYSTTRRIHLKRVYTTFSFSVDGYRQGYR